MPILTPRKARSPSPSSKSEKKNDPVKIFCRLKPLKEDIDPCCVKLISPTTLSLTSALQHKLLRKDIQYNFKHIFTAQSTQKEVFQHVAYPLLQDLLLGKNGLLFTYGVIGSGKTYSLAGDKRDEPGILPRCINTLFNTINDYQAKKFLIKSDKMNGFEVQSDSDAAEARHLEHKKLQSIKLNKKGSGDKCVYVNDGTVINGINQLSLYAVFITYIEVYNNTVYDLLDETGGKMLQSKILREDAQKYMYINNVVEVEVKSTSEAYELFNLGQKRKRMGHTILNSQSGKSHSIFNIRLVELMQPMQNRQGNLVVPDTNNLQVSQLSLVDLAGSERCSRTHNTGLRLKEASKINHSLMSLRICFEILRDNQLNGANRLVPYRDSRLTLLLKNYFEGEGCVHMVVCVNPAADDYDENLHVMNFAQMLKDVKTHKGESRCSPYREEVISNQMPSSSKRTTTETLTFGPEIPNVKLDLSSFEACNASITRFMEALDARRENSIAFNRELAAKEQKFRQRLIQMEQDKTISKQEINSLRNIIRREKNREELRAPIPKITIESPTATPQK